MRMYLTFMESLSPITLAARMSYSHVVMESGLLRESSSYHYHTWRDTDPNNLRTSPFSSNIEEYKKRVEVLLHR